MSMGSHLPHLVLTRQEKQLREACSCSISGLNTMIKIFIHDTNPMRIMRPKGLLAFWIIFLLAIPQAQVDGQLVSRQQAYAELKTANG